jgi:hypothetical protein
MTECAELKYMVDYDPWVIAHQLVPFIAIMNGISYLEVIVLVYAWETFETILFNCAGVSEVESATNALISDPFQCFFGLVVAWSFIRDTGPLVTGSRLVSYGMTAIYVIPGVFTAINLVWVMMGTFILVMCCMLYFLGDEKKWFVMTLVYVVVLSVLVITLEDHFNSFYTGLIVAVAATSMGMLVKKVRPNNLF